MARVCFGSCADCTLSPDSILFVDVDATGENNGTSWTNAYVDLQDALSAADCNPNINQVWVADITRFFFHTKSFFIRKSLPDILAYSI